jgi:gluconolactonase
MWSKAEHPEPVSILEPGEAERLATGYVFTEGPLWNPDGYYHYVDIMSDKFYRIVPGKEPELVRENTGKGNGTTYDLDGNILMCEGGNRRISRMYPDGRVETLADNFEGKRFTQPNDIVCKSDGSVYFTDPGLLVPLAERDLPYSSVYRIMPDGSVVHVADCEYPNGLAFSPDERILYVSNTRWTRYILAFELDTDGAVVRRRIFADLSVSDAPVGVPDGMKVDVEGRVYCTGPGGTWVFDASGRKLGVIETPEVPANMAFGGPDMKTLFLTARTSVYTLRMKTAGVAHPRFRR